MLNFLAVSHKLHSFWAKKVLVFLAAVFTSTLNELIFKILTDISAVGV
jgi:hypothetical protein